MIHFHRFIISLVDTPERLQLQLRIHLEGEGPDGRRHSLVRLMLWHPPLVGDEGSGVLHRLSDSSIRGRNRASALWCTAPRASTQAGGNVPMVFWNSRRRHHEALTGIAATPLAPRVALRIVGHHDGSKNEQQDTRLGRQKIRKETGTANRTHGHCAGDGRMREGVRLLLFFLEKL